MTIHQKLEFVNSHPKKKGDNIMALEFNYSRPGAKGQNLFKDFWASLAAHATNTTPGWKTQEINDKRDAEFNRVMSDITANSENATSTPNTTTVGSGGGGNRGTGTSSSNYASASQLAEYQQAIDQLNHGLGRLDPQLNIALDNLRKKFDQSTNEINSQYSRAENQYGTQSTQNQQNRVRNNENINNQASNGLRGLQQLLGSMGAVGSDMLLAGRAVQDKANADRSGAGSTFAQNQQNLDTNWAYTKDDFDGERKKLNDWYGENQRSIQSQSAAQRQSLSTQLAQLKGQQASAQGKNGADAARADLNAANSLSAKIDELARINPSYTGKSINYNPQSLDSYGVGGSTAIGVAGQGTATSDPLLQGYKTNDDPDEERRKRELGL